MTRRFATSLDRFGPAPQPRPRPTHSHHPAGTDEGAGSLTVMDGAFGDDDCAGGLSVSSCEGGIMVVASTLT